MIYQTMFKISHIFEKKMLIKSNYLASNLKCLAKTRYNIHFSHLNLHSQ